VNITQFHDFSKTYPGLEITIFEMPLLSRFSTSVRTLNIFIERRVLWTPLILFLSTKHLPVMLLVWRCESGRGLPLHSRCARLSWRSWRRCRRSSRRRSPPPRARWARSAPRCSAPPMRAGSPSSAGAMTNVPMATTQTDIVVMPISGAKRNRTVVFWVCLKPN